jgi:hypothetical protein
MTLRRIAISTGLLFALNAFVHEAQAADEGVHVCIGPDGSLRYEVRDECPKGHRSYRLAEVEEEIDGPEEESPEAAQVSELKKQVAQLSARLASLERGPTGEGQSGDRREGGSRVTAPFEVVDDNGTTLFRVKEGDGESTRGAYIYNDRGTLVAQLATTSAGGGKMFVYSGSTDYAKHAGVMWQPSGGELRVDRASGNKLLRLNAESGFTLYRTDGTASGKWDAAGIAVLGDGGSKALARLGRSAAGSNLLLGTASGKRLLAFSATEQGALIELNHLDSSVAGKWDSAGVFVHNSAGGRAVGLSSRPSGNGILQVNNAGGGVSVEAGTTDEGVGMVIAGPRYRCVAVAGPTAMVGAVPDCLKGKLK